MEKINETKQKLLDAACAVFREKGYEKAKVSDIVAMADVAQGTFYLYFKSKRECLNNLSSMLIKMFLDDLEREMSIMDEQSIYRVVKLLHESILKHKEILVILHFEQSNFDDNVISMQTQAHSHVDRIIEKALLAKGLSERSAMIKTYMISSAFSQFLLDELFVINPALRVDRSNILEMLTIIIDEVTC